MRLQCLSLSRVNLGLQGAELLKGILDDQPPSIKELDLSWNKIPIKSMSMLLESICVNNKITNLNLAFNPIS